MTDLIK